MCIATAVEAGGPVRVEDGGKLPTRGVLPSYRKRKKVRNNVRKTWIEGERDFKESRGREGSK